MLVETSLSLHRNSSGLRCSLPSYLQLDKKNDGFSRIAEGMFCPFNFDKIVRVAFDTLIPGTPGLLLTAWGVHMPPLFPSRYSGKRWLGNLYIFTHTSPGSKWYSKYIINPHLKNCVFTSCNELFIDASAQVKVLPPLLCK